MSGGEQQMLAIARTLMGNPDAVLLDEPSEGLAPVIVALMAEAVLAMKDEGVAVLLCEQNLRFRRRRGDRAVVIERGQIRWEGRFADLTTDARLKDELLSVDRGGQCRPSTRSTLRALTRCTKDPISGAPRPPRP